MTDTVRGMTTRVAVVEHEPTCPVDRFGTWLTEAGCRVDVYRPYAGEPVPDPAEADGFIVLGGQMGAYDDATAPWLPDVRDRLAQAAARGVPTLGICLGAQLLAVACGGRVEVGALGVEAAVVLARWRPEAATDELVAGLPDPFPGPSMHDDAIVVLPPDAVWLASSAMYDHQVFRVGARSWGVQFHPEASVSTFRGWADGHPEPVRYAALDALVEQDAEVAAAGRALAQRFAAVVREHAPVRA